MTHLGFRREVSSGPMKCPPSSDGVAPLKPLSRLAQLLARAGGYPPSSDGDPIEANGPAPKADVVHVYLYPPSSDGGPIEATVAGRAYTPLHRDIRRLRTVAPLKLGLRFLRAALDGRYPPSSDGGPIEARMASLTSRTAAAISAVFGRLIESLASNVRHLRTAAP